MSVTSPPPWNDIAAATRSNVAIYGIDPVKVEALMLAWFAFYLFTLVAPEPVTKVLDVLMTASSDGERPTRRGR